MSKRELLILRHGKSDWDIPVDDFDRPLKKRGRKGANEMGLWLRREGLIPDHIVSSPAVRARTTAENACKAMRIDANTIVHAQGVYLADLQDLLQVLADCPESAQRVMLVGHNPGLEDLLEFLGGDRVGPPDDGKLLPTATLARLRLPEDWTDLEEGCADVLSITRPGAIPK